VVNENAMKLKLPKSMEKVHNAFNVDRLIKYKTNPEKFKSRPIPKATPISMDNKTGEKLYIVKTLLKKRQFNG
jgi:hypothetical protein